MEGDFRGFIAHKLVLRDSGELSSGRLVGPAGQHLALYAAHSGIGYPRHGIQKRQKRSDAILCDRKAQKGRVKCTLGSGL